MHWEVVWGETKLKGDTVRYWEKKPLHLKRSAPKYYEAMKWWKRYGAGREFTVILPEAYMALHQTRHRMVGIVGRRCRRCRTHSQRVADMFGSNKPFLIHFYIFLHIFTINGSEFAVVDMMKDCVVEETPRIDLGHIKCSKKYEKR